MKSPAIMESLDTFDWMGHKHDGGPATIREPFLMFQAPDETARDRQLRMLRQVRNTCMSCTMCDLGRQEVTKDIRIRRDPHVFSNQNPSRFMVVGQNPGFTEVEKCVPFVGIAGQNFDNELQANGLSRDDFYICNIVRCYTTNNMKPSDHHIKRCSPFLQIEINLLQPFLVITLGAVAFGGLCPNVRFNNGLGTITDSSVYNVPVFAIYHPSPINLKDDAVSQMFKKQMRIMCALVRKLQDRSAVAI